MKEKINMKKYKRFSMFFITLIVIALCSFFTINKIDYHKKQQHIPVFLGADNNYAPYVATTMASVLKNTKSHIDFVILSNGISRENQTKIRNTKKFFPNASFSVKFVEIDMTKFSKFNEGFGFITQTAYTRWLIPEVGKDLDKAIWLDCDIILQGDIYELYNENLEGKIIGVIPDMLDIVYGLKRHELLKKYGKFKNIYVWNSGVQLIDCNKWRENDITNKLITQKRKIVEYHKKNNLQIGSADQDTSNIVMQDYKILPLKYNTHVSAVDICNKLKTCKKLFNSSKDNLLRNAVVIHYAAKDAKPWNNVKILKGEEFCKIIQYTDFENNMSDHFKKECNNIKKQITKK